MNSLTEFSAAKLCIQNDSGTRSTGSPRRAAITRSRFLTDGGLSASGRPRDGATRVVRAVAERRLPGRVLAGAAHDDHADVLGPADDRHHRLGGVDDVPALDLLALVLEAEPLEREPRVLEEELLDLLLA